ncbi:hypothetical protein SHKM778_76040 [Streptomyces sp. KM77-8]|uniref:Secreted protein n=1 Tax=Streptomyces haneummycinicus TaxID=3074435 RepID=A0AAT9HUL8_9ACTN
MVAALVSGVGAEARCPWAVVEEAEAPVPVEQGYVDAVGARLGVQVGQVGAAGRVAGGDAVLELVEQYGAAARGEQMPDGDGVDGGQPCVGMPQILRIVGPRGPVGGRQPSGEAPGVHLGAEVGAGAQDDVQPLLGGGVQEQPQVPHTGEVVPAGRGEW